MQVRPWDFGVKEAPAREWSEGMGSLIAVAMFAGGVAGGTYLASLYFNSIGGMLVGWIFALGMGLFDMAHLSKPTRVWRIAFRANSSWISRGFIFVLLFIGAAGIQLLLHLVSAPAAAENFFRVVAGILAFGVAIYSGFVVGYVNGIKFWNSAMLPILVVLGGLAAGLAVLMALTVTPDKVSTLQFLAPALLVIYAVATFVHLWVSTYNGPSAKDSALLLLKGNLAGIFWSVVVVIGMVIPFILEITANDMRPALIVSAVLVLAGYLALRYLIIRAGRYVPLI